MVFPQVQMLHIKWSGNHIPERIRKSKKNIWFQNVFKTFYAIGNSDKVVFVTPTPNPHFIYC